MWPRPDGACARLGQPHRGAHLLGDRAGHVAEALLVDRDDLVEQVGAVLFRGRGKGRERGLGGGDGLVDIGLRADRDAGVGLFGGRVLDVQRARGHRIDPFAIDVEFQVIAHGRLLGVICAG